MRVATDSPEATERWAEKLAASLRASDVLVLTGQLGAGKTCFVRGLARGLDISETISSPTFTLIDEHTGGRLPLYHIDLYRLNDESDLTELGLDDYLERDDICCVEWGERLGSAKPADAVTINFIREGDTERTIEIIEDNARATEICDNLRSAG